MASKYFLILYYISISYFQLNVSFNYESEESNNKTSVANLIHTIVDKYLTDCTLYVLYDDFFYNTIPYNFVVEKVLKSFTKPFVHGYMDVFNQHQSGMSVGKERKSCVHYVALVAEADFATRTLGTQLDSKLVLISAMSIWQIKEFLLSYEARKIQNLLVIADPTLQREYFKAKSTSVDINLYTHELHVDGIGSSFPMILTAWREDRFTRPHINLFPRKMKTGFNGHRFSISAVEQPPFVFRRQRSSLSSDDQSAWDGVEIRSLRLLADLFNITLSIQDAVNTGGDHDGAVQVIKDVSEGKADIGISGLYITTQYNNIVHFSTAHSQDCATFLILASTAIPKYRAILGPFQWLVWVCIITIYLLGVIPICYSQRMSFRRMFDRRSDIGYTFWIVFGTFTNCFTFKGPLSWSNVTKNSTRSMIGTYWIFTIIIMSAYSSSIISFITIPTYFQVADSVKDLLDEEFRVGTLDTREWKSWFNATTDHSTNKLMKNIDILPNVTVGFEKVTQRKRYAFLGSKEYLTFLAWNDIIASKTENKKSAYHLLNECLTQFMVSWAMKPKSDFLRKFDSTIIRLQENGLLGKIKRDVEWEIIRSSTGKLLAATSGSLRHAIPEDRQLTVDDMQGMFLLLGIGIVFAFAALINECCTGYKFFQEIPRIPSIILTHDDSRSSSHTFLQSNVIKHAVSATCAIGNFIHNTKRILSARRFSL